MTKVIKQLIFIAVLTMSLGCRNQSNENIVVTEEEEVLPGIPVYSSTHLLTAESANRITRSETSAIFIDLRKKEEFLSGHLPGAVNIWRPDFENPSYPYGGMMASSEQIAALLSTHGISNHDHIILYDSKGNVDASKLWWILKYYGHSPLSMLQGGIQAWQESGFALDTLFKPRDPTSYQFSSDEDHSLYASKEDILQAMADSNYVIIDTRSSDEYSGKRQKKGAFRAGHIPGSIHLDYIYGIDHNGPVPYFRDSAGLTAMFEQAGVTSDKKIYTYCQSGVRSAHTTFVLSELLRYPEVRNYDGSWIEWSYNTELPIEQDSTTQFFD